MHKYLDPTGISVIDLDRFPAQPQKEDTRTGLRNQRVSLHAEEIIYIFYHCTQHFSAERKSE